MLFSTLTAISISLSIAAAMDMDTANQHATQIINNIEQVSDGVVHLGDDGVLRSFDGDMRVIDYVQFSPEQIEQAIGGDVGDTFQHLRGVFDGVDGRTVTDPNQLRNPAPELLPKTSQGQYRGGEEDQNTGRELKPGAELFKKGEQRCPEDMKCEKKAECERVLCRTCFKRDDIVFGKCQ